MFLIPDLEQCGLELLLSSDFVLWFEPDGRERVGCFAAWSAFLGSAPGPFARAHATVASFPLPGGRRARLMARSLPLSREERDASARVLAALLPSRGQREDASPRT